MEDDASSLLVTKLMQTRHNIGNNNGSSSSHVSQQIAVSTAAATASVINGTEKTASTEWHFDHFSVDPLEEQGSADGLHQLSLYIFALFFDCYICNPRVYVTLAKTSLSVLLFTSNCYFS